MTQDDIIEFGKQAGLEAFNYPELITEDAWEKIEAFAKLVAAKEREDITDEYWSCVQADLENGVKSLNQKATEDFYRTMPELSKFGKWLEARGEA